MLLFIPLYPPISDLLVLTDSLAKKHTCFRFSGCRFAKKPCKSLVDGIAAKK